MDLTQLLRGVELFHGLRDNDLEEVAAIFEENQYPAGELIAKQGELWGFPLFSHRRIC